MRKVVIEILCQFDLDQQLCLFSRDEVFTWFHTRSKACSTADITFRNHVALNIEGVVKKAELMSCRHERGQARCFTYCFLVPYSPGFLLQDNKNAERPIPVMQTVTQLISIATNPLKLALMSDAFSPWY